MPKAAFIGLGNIGKVLAGRVAAAPDLSGLSVFDLEPALGEELAASYGKVTSAANVAEAAAGADVILTCLPRSSNVKVFADSHHRRHHRRRHRHRHHPHPHPSSIDTSPHSSPSRVSPTS